VPAGWPIREFAISIATVITENRTGGPPLRILVVEDDVKLASFIVKGFEQSGFAVDHAGNGEDGLFLAQTEPYDDKWQRR
jgi:ActR/RegA family two-component response regulator